MLLLFFLHLVSFLSDFSIKYIISYLTEHNMIHPNHRYQNTSLKIVNSSIDTKATSQEIPKIRECRICLENSEESDKKLISPCKCIGSVEYVHEECIQAWIKSSLQSKSRWERFTATKDGLQCEMCKEPIKFTEKTEIQCRDCAALSRILKQKKIILVVVILLIVISLGGIGICLVNMMDLLSYRGDIQFELILSVCGIILLFVFFTVAIYTSVVEFFLVKKMVIGDIQEKIPRKNQSVSSITIIDIV